MVSTMTSRERVLAALRGQEYDHIPVISPTSLANVDCMKTSKASFPYANLNAIKMAALAETSYTVLKYDSILPCFSIASEAGALGCDVSWGGNEWMPTVNGGFLKTLNDFKMPQNYLDRKPLRAVINAEILLKKRYQNEVALIGKVLGPLSLLFHMYGIQNTLNSLILEPTAIIQVLDMIKDLVIAYAQAQIAAGVDIITLSEDAAGDLISREGYRQLVMASERAIFQALQKDTFVVFHLSGDIMDRADLFAQTGFHALSYDSRNRLPQLKSLVGDMKLIGGVNNPITLLNGKKNDIYQEVFYALENGVSLIAPECTIPLRVTNENLVAIREAVKIFEKRTMRM